MQFRYWCLAWHSQTRHTCLTKSANDPWNFWTRSCPSDRTSREPRIYNIFKLKKKTWMKATNVLRKSSSELLDRLQIWIVYMEKLKHLADKILFGQRKATLGHVSIGQLHNWRLLREYLHIFEYVQELSCASSDNTFQIVIVCLAISLLDQFEYATGRDPFIKGT